MDMATGSDLLSRGRITARRDLLVLVVGKPVGTPEARVASVIVTAVTVTVIVTVTLRLIEKITDRQPEGSEKIVANKRIAKDAHLKQRTEDMLKPRTTWQLPSWVMPGHFARLMEDNSSTRETFWSGSRRLRPRTSHLHC
jgi:hypothetical protein